MTQGSPRAQFGFKPTHKLAGGDTHALATCHCAPQSRPLLSFLEGTPPSGCNHPSSGQWRGMSESCMSPTFPVTLGGVLLQVWEDGAPMPAAVALRPLLSVNEVLPNYEQSLKSQQKRKLRLTPGQSFQEIHRGELSENSTSDSARTEAVMAASWHL